MGLILGTALVAALLGVRPVSGQEEASASPAESATHLHWVLVNRSVGDFFPSH